MAKNILKFLWLPLIGIIGLFSCVKTTNKNIDYTRNYFPLVMGKYVTYDVDSIYYGTGYDTTLTGAVETSCIQYEIKSQMKYAITDTTRGLDDSLIYMMSIYYRHFDGDIWQKEGNVLYVRSSGDSLVVTQDGNKYLKLRFPIVNGMSWPGNEMVNVNLPQNYYLNNWFYTYSYKGLSYNNDLHKYDNTVTVLEADESSNYPYVDTAVEAYRTYAKEVYAYNVGMVYKEWTHIAYSAATAHCPNGYTVIMKAVDHN